MTDRAQAVAHPYAASNRPKMSSQTSRAVTAIVGNVLEWFDFSMYAFLATVIAKAIFPAGDEFAAMLGTFGAFGLGFAARPLGAIIFGWLGAKKSRKWTLTFVMPLMAVAMLLMALIPSYATIGLAAPVLLVCARMFQGLSVGGELGNAVAYLVEWAPQNRRGFYGSFQQCSTLGGMLLGSGRRRAHDDAAQSAGDARLGLARAVRDRHADHRADRLGSSAAAATKPPSTNRPPTPRRRRARPRCSACRHALVIVVWTVSLYVLLNYLPSFTTKYVGLNALSALWINMAGMLVMTATIPFWCALSDRYGRKPIYAFGRHRVSRAAVSDLP